MKKVNCGVVGVGYLGAHHARIYSEMNQVNLVGIYDLNPKRAQEVADLYHCPVFASVEELAQQCDALSVVTPTTVHAATAIPLLKMGRHLLVEKPLCVSLEEAEAMLRTAEEHKCYLQVGHIEHYNPVNSFLETHVQDPKYITADRLAPFSPRGADVGVVLDLMIHDLGIVLQLVRSPIELIEAIGVNVVSKTEDIANARIYFANGCIANFNTSRVSLKKSREIRVFQPNRYLSLDFMEQKGHVLYKSNGEICKEEIPIHKEEPLRVELNSFVDCILQSHQPKVNGEVAKSALAVALEITHLIQKNTLSS